MIATMSITRTYSAPIAIAAATALISLSAPVAAAHPGNAAPPVSFQAQGTATTGPPAPSLTASKTELQHRIDQASADFQAKGGRVGIALLDRHSGMLLTNDTGDQTFPLASVTKILIAEQVAFHNYTHPEDDKDGKKSHAASPGKDPEMTVDETSLEDMLARDNMIRLSDNEATDLLWERYGGTQLVGEVAERYGLENTRDVGFWPGAQSTAADMATFLGGVLDGDGGLGQRETIYFADLMHSVPKFSYGMMDQDFGVRGGLPEETVGTKNGWDGRLINNSTGIFGPNNQFVMVVLSGNSNPEDVTEAVRTVFPEGKVAESGPSSRAITVPEAPEAAADSSVLPKSPTTKWVTGMLVALILGFSAGWLLRKQARAE